MKGMHLAEDLTQALARARHRPPRSHRQRRRRHRRRRRRHPRPAQQAHPRLDHRQRHRLRPLALCRRRLGGRPHRRLARSQRDATAAAAASAISKASWATAPCACASSISNRKRSSPTPNRATRAAGEFVELWHRALAAATASFIHLAGPGRFYFTGHNVGFLELPTLRAQIESMVKMSTLQSFSLEILAPRRRHRAPRRGRLRPPRLSVLIGNPNTGRPWSRF